MIVTSYKALSIELCSSKFLLERDSKKPGKVTLIERATGIKIDLPAQPQEVENVIRAYRHITEADIGYRTVDVP